MARVLVVDDVELFRKFVCGALGTRPELQVVAEVCDGLEAVHQAVELKPDLIVLDIGLPKLNGIEAARQIRQLSPGSKIVFLSQNNDLDVVQAALDTGALGYVYKANAQEELLNAVDTVLRGKQFVSRALRGSEFTDTPRAKAPHSHEVLFYSDDTVFLDHFTRFIAAALKAGDAAIVVATESHRDSFLQKLKAEGVDVDGALQQGTYIPLDVAKTLSTFMVNDMPDAVRLFEVVSGLIETAAKATKREHSRVVACGEGVSLLLAEGKPDAAIRLEQLWDEVATAFDVDILCGYALSSFHGKKYEHIFESICAEHSAVYPR
jgi:DNA-binding NarL/FixJ family response regulator